MTRSARRSVLIIVAGFVVAFVGCAIIVGALEGPTRVPDILLTSLAIGLIGSALVTGWLSRPASTEMRAMSGKDLELKRKLKNTVYRGYEEPLDDDQLDLPRRFAEAAVVERGYSLAYITLLYAGLLVPRVQELTEKKFDGLDFSVLALIVIVYVTFVPFTVRQILRARAYLRAHPQRLEPATRSQGNS